MTCLDQTDTKLTPRIQINQIYNKVLSKKEETIFSQKISTQMVQQETKIQYTLNLSNKRTSPPYAYRVNSRETKNGPKYMASEESKITIF